MFVLILSILSVNYAQTAELKPTNVLPAAEDVLRPRIDFWIKVYTDLTTSQGVIHDAKYPELIYEKLDFTEDYHDLRLSAKARDKKIKGRIKHLKEFYTKLLLSIHKKESKPESLTDAERRIYEMFKKVNEPKKFFSAAHNKRVRYQLGQKDRFAQGLFYSGRYLSSMERIFKDKGLPLEITRLPFVESSFNIQARSKVGASGVWQFMRSTGKYYLKINEILDERNDPLRATEAAADLLKLNYESLGNWPMAITAYNHGRKGMMRAARKIGTESLAEIIDNYRSRSFGFASSNFYCSFIAAVEVEKNADKYFGKIERDKPLDFTEVVLNDFIDIHDIATYSQIPLDTLLEYNPALTDNLVKKKFYVPAQYTLRIPVTMRETFLARYNQIPPNKKHTTQKNFLLGKTL